MTTESAVSLADIPLANGLPLIGNLLDMIRSPVEFLYGQHRELGDIFRVHVATKTDMDKVEQGRREHPEWFTNGDIHAHTMMPFTGCVSGVAGIDGHFHITVHHFGVDKVRVFLI